MNFVTPRLFLISTLVLLLGGCKTITSLNLLGVFDSGLGEGASEIVSYDNKTGKAFIVNATQKTVDVLILNADGSLPATPDFTIDVTEASDLIELGGANSVDARDGILAIAIEADDKQQNGVVAFYRTDNYQWLNTVEVGALPDMVTFTPNGKMVLVANEGEPSDDYRIDPQGTVSIIKLNRGNPANTPKVFTVDFEAFNEGGPRHDELPAEVRIFGPGASVAQDLEPEYIAVSENSKKAWVSFQENSAMAVINLKRKKVEKIVAFGFKDHSLPGNELDASNRDDAINIRNWPVLGMFQPDAIDAYRSRGKTYIVTANEGDAREYLVDADQYADEAACLADGGLDFDEDDGCLFYTEEARVKDLMLDPVVFNDSSLQDDENLGRLKTTTTLGDANNDGYYEQIYSYGARSFSIWSANGDLVFDSGADIANVTASELGLPGFNADDSRSDDKGAEPESVVVGYVDGRNYAFVGLERTGGIMVYDITDPYAVDFILYLDEGPDHISPEGIEFISAGDSPTGKALLMVAHEISGTTTVYEIETDYSPQL